MDRSMPKDDTLYAALVDRDSSYEGIFVVAVRTTGVFCRPTCTARKPKRENVEFFSTTNEALQHGYRPCKVCRPMEHRGAAPEWLAPLLEEIDAGSGLMMRDADLRLRGLDPSRVRHWFKKHHGMTFQAYLRALRVGQAFGRIRYGEKVASAAKMTRGTNTAESPAKF